MGGLCRVFYSLLLYIRIFFLCKHVTETELHLSGLTFFALILRDEYMWPRLHRALPFAMTSFESETEPWAVSQRRLCHTWQGLFTSLCHYYSTVGHVFPSTINLQSLA